MITRKTTEKKLTKEQMIQEMARLIAEIDLKDKLQKQSFKQLTERIKQIIEEE